MRKLRTLWARILAPALLAAAAAASASWSQEPFLTGVNLSGAEFGQASLPGVYNTHYIYPNQQEVDYFQGKGMNCLRLCFRWERLQRSAFADFDSAEFSRFDGFVSQATAKGMVVILDPHNFARYYPDPPTAYQTATTGLLGNDISYAAFADFWGRLAAAYRTNARVIFGLMNEPANMPTEDWLAAANAVIAAIREAGAAQLILVPGNGYSGAHSWEHNWYGTPNGTAMLGVVDPLDHYAYEVHQYLDSDSSGTSPTIVNPAIGVTRLAGFTQWCKDNNKRGFLGEFAVANSTIGEGMGDEAIDNMLSHIEANRDVWLGWTWWAAGPWWGEYMFTIEPQNLGASPIDRPVMSALIEHIPIPSTILQYVSYTQFEFRTFTGFVYQPQITTNLLTDTWTAHGPPIPGNSSAGTSTVAAPAIDAPVYLRVRVTRAP